MRNILLTLGLVICLSSVCYAWDSYTDTQHNTVDIEQPTENTANVYVNGQYEGSAEHTPTGQETLDKIFDKIDNN